MTGNIFQVGGVQPGGLYADKDFAGAGFGLRNLLNFQNGGRSEGVEA
jgi:hypothetical protein